MDAYGRPLPRNADCQPSEQLKRKTAFIPLRTSTDKLMPLRNLEGLRMLPGRSVDLGGHRQWQLP